MDDGGRYWWNGGMMRRREKDGNDGEKKIETERKRKRGMWEGR